jgi:hypothetical protein
LHALTDRELFEHLEKQSTILRSEVETYRKGNLSIAVKIAGTLRTIFYRSQTSTPLLPDLSNKYGIELKFAGRNQDGLDEYVVLYTGFTVGNRDPVFDAPFLIPKSFADYWNEVVYIEGQVRYYRRQIVLWAANKLGGDHVDPQIPNELQHLVNGQVKLVSQKYGEEPIINQVVYEMALQTLGILDWLIPQLENKIPQ